jgi:hypothetical protein
MNEEFHRLGAFRGVLVVVVAALAAVAGLASSGLSVAADDHAVATVRPEVPAPIATVAAAPTPRRTVARRHRQTAARPRLKHCRAVAGVEFRVSVGTRCPTPLKHAGAAPHLSAKLRRAASRPRPVVGPPAKQPASTTTANQTPTTTAKQPAATTTSRKPDTGVKSTNGAAEAQTQTKGTD